MAQSPREYEQFVRDVTQALVHAQGLETVTVQHDVQLVGLSRTHQVDVYWEYRLGGAIHRVIINCKLYQSTVQVNDVLIMKGVLADFPGAVGVIVTTVGFQKGAIDYARTHSIGLKVIRPPTDEDYGDRLRVLAGTILPRHYAPLGFSLGVDKPWLTANLAPEEAARWDGPVTLHGGDLVEDRLTGTLTSVRDLWGVAIRESGERHGPTAVDEQRSHTITFADAHYRHPALGAAKLNEIIFRWTMLQGEPVAFEVRFDSAAIVRDAIEGTLLFIDDAGVVSGDLDTAAPRLTKPSA